MHSHQDFKMGVRQINMKNICEYYIKKYSTGGLKPCDNKARYLLIYYNKLEDAVKTFFLCDRCHSDLAIKNMEHIASVKSVVIKLESLKPKK